MMKNKETIKEPISEGLKMNENQISILKKSLSGVCKPYYKELSQVLLMT